MVPVILAKLQLLVKANEERAFESLDIFDELIACEVGVTLKVLQCSGYKYKQAQKIHKDELLLGRQFISNPSFYGSTSHP